MDYLTNQALLFNQSRKRMPTVAFDVGIFQCDGRETSMKGFFGSVDDRCDSGTSLMGEPGDPTSTFCQQLNSRVLACIRCSTFPKAA